MRRCSCRANRQTACAIYLKGDDGVGARGPTLSQAAIDSLIPRLSVRPSEDDFRRGLINFPSLKFVGPWR